MNFDLLFLIIMTTSFIGMSVLVARKIPVIVRIPNEPVSGKTNFKEQFTKKTKDAIIKKRFSTGIFLQKTLVRTRVRILKLDNKIFFLNQKLKENTKKAKENIDLEIDQIKKK